MFSSITKPAKPSRIRILLNGGNDGDFQWARVRGYPRQGKGDGSHYVNFELDITPARTDLSQRQAMELVLSTFPSNHQLCIQRFRWGDALPVESLLPHLQCHHPTATTQVLAPPPPRGIVKLSLSQCIFTEAALTLLIQYMQTPVSSSHHCGCSLRELYVSESIDGRGYIPMFAGATSTGLTIASMVAMRPSQNAVLDSPSARPRLEHTYGSQIRFLSLQLSSHDNGAFTNALKMNPDAYSMHTLQLYGDGFLPYVEDDDFSNLVEVLPNAVALRELQIESFSINNQEEEHPFSMLRSIRDNGSLHMVTTMEFSSADEDFEYDIDDNYDGDEDDDDGSYEWVTPYDDDFSDPMSRLVRAYCRRNRKLPNLLARKPLVHSDQDMVTQRKPKKRHKSEEMNESSVTHHDALTSLLPTLLSAANQTPRTRPTLIVSGLLNYWPEFFASV